MDKLLTLSDKGICVSLRVTPNASKSAINGVWNGTHIKVFLRAPAVDGKANEALVDFLSKEWQIKKKNIFIVTGQTARCKVVLITEQEKYEWLKQKLLTANK